MQEREIVGRVAKGELGTISVRRDRERAGWVATLVADNGDEIHLETKRGREIRLFKTSDAVLRWCERVGVREVVVHL